MIEYHKYKKSFATLNVYKRYGVDPKSMIIFDKKHRIEKFVERPETEDIKEDFVWESGFFFIFKPEIYSYLPKEVKSDFGKDIFPRLLKERKNLYVYPTEDYFIDIGNLEKLEKARKTYVF